MKQIMMDNLASFSIEIYHRLIQLIIHILTQRKVWLLVTTLLCNNFTMMLILIEKLQMKYDNLEVEQLLYLISIKA
jgi:hypothetical protein